MESKGRWVLAGRVGGMAGLPVALRGGPCSLASSKDCSALWSPGQPEALPRGAPHEGLVAHWSRSPGHVLATTAGSALTARSLGCSPAGMLCTWDPLSLLKRKQKRRGKVKPRPMPPTFLENDENKMKLYTSSLRLCLSHHLCLFSMPQILG